MRPDQRAAWLELDRLAPWLAHADRIAVEVTATLIATFRVAGSSMAPPLFTRMETMLGRLGLTPADRSKVSAPRPVGGNRFADRGKRPAAKAKP
ncbi:hypothetical protein ASC76_17765 [Rhizobacter sp. Root404]|nr:hypothetical protein ASC76_17765 [Rhizobacter sp. Root404]